MNKIITKLAFVATLAICVQAVAHPGRTDASGGHNGPDGYHKHNAGTKADAPAAAKPDAKAMPTKADAPAAAKTPAAKAPAAKPDAKTEPAKAAPVAAKTPAAKAPTARTTAVPKDKAPAATPVTN